MKTLQVKVRPDSWEWLNAAWPSMCGNHQGDSAMTNALKTGQPAGSQEAGSSSAWRPMNTAPKNGDGVLLLIEGGEHPLQDEDPSVSIGSFGTEGGPEEDPTWNFAGWSWHQDGYCRGTGEPIGWMPLPPAPTDHTHEGAVPAAGARGWDVKELNPGHPITPKE